MKRKISKYKMQEKKNNNYVHIFFNIFNKSKKSHTRVGLRKRNKERQPILLLRDNPLYKKEARFILEQEKKYEKFMMQKEDEEYDILYQDITEEEQLDVRFIAQIGVKKLFIMHIDHFTTSDEEYKLKALEMDKI